jgi:hypothetical protein
MKECGRNIYANFSYAYKALPASVFSLEKMNKIELNYVVSSFAV